MRKSEMWTPRPTKGEYKGEGLQLITFDAVRKCREEKCPIFEDCPYSSERKCQVEMKYLEAIRENLMTIPGNKITQGFMDKVSLHLMPLFHQLIKFQITAYGVDRICYTTVQGAIKVHPIYSEIRKTISAIESTQRSLGIDLEYHRALGLVRGTKGAAKGRDPEAYGDPDYVEAMAGEIDEIREEMNPVLFPDGKVNPNLRRSRKRITSREDEENGED